MEGPLGTGAYADVYAVREGGVLVAKKKFFAGQEATAAIEADFLRSFDHPNIIKFLVTFSLSLT